MRTELQIGTVVDRLGKVLGERADITEEIDALKADIIVFAAHNPPARAFEGDLFRATVSFSDKRKTDWSAVLDELCRTYGIPAATCGSVVLRHTEIAEAVPAVRVAARKGV